MKFSIKNNIENPPGTGIGIEVGFLDLSANFVFQTYQPGDVIIGDESEQLIALLLPHGTQFSFKHNNRLHFEFVQVKPIDSNHNGKDSYVFLIHIDWNEHINHPSQVGHFEITISGPGGDDGQVGNPNPNRPFG